jgi:hypothetical protein
LPELQGDASAPPAHVQNVQIVQKSSSVSSFEHFEQIEQIEHQADPVLAPADDTRLTPKK